ncbi:MAG: septal ring lytic transglycosylase RlpA family protein [Rubrobacter sp.]|nr:septal ring lytic transglycosylase RlpA family protein [Rubrobacter sp.]
MVGNGRALRALYVTGALAAAVLFMVVMSARADAQTQPMVASFYGEELRGSPTATGEPFDPDGLTAAHQTLPFGTQLEVCYVDCTVVTINDRGPFVEGRELDLSAGAARAVGLTGVDTVQTSLVGEGGSAAPAPEPAPEPAAEPAPEPAPEPAAEPVAAEPQAAPEVSQSGGSENVQLVEQNVDITQNIAQDVTVFESAPGVFFAEAVVPVNGDFAAAQAEADRIVQEAAQAAANGAIAV